MRLACLTLLASALFAAQFEDITARSGITFRHQKSATSRKYLIESVSGGVAMFDYDGDGFLDLYFVNGAALTDPMKAGAAPNKSDPKYWNRLYRNRRDGTFEDVTEKAGVKGAGYGMGAAAGDFDRDGRVDLYVTGLGGNKLYRNKGDGTFEDVTTRSGTEAGGWSTSAAWIDLDGDQYPELIVARYLKWDFEPDIWCGAREPGRRAYCHPDKFEPISQLVFRNNRDGTFTQIELPTGKGLGLAVNDFDRDGRLDIAIANDAFPQQLFRNLGGLKFQNVALESNVAYDDDGHVFSGMGVDFADYDNDGWPDLLINALGLQRYALFRNVKGSFEYVSPSTGIAKLTQLNSGWGVKFADFDNDGRKDIFVAQGHVMDNIHLTQPNLKYLEPLLLLRNESNRFTDISAQAGPAFQVPLASRGAAVGDLDNDGRLDIVINVNDGPAKILRNVTRSANYWLRVNAEPGSQVKITLPNGAAQFAIASPAGSYLSSNDPRVHFGLGSHTSVQTVEITTSSGAKHVQHNVAASEPAP